MEESLNWESTYAIALALRQRYPGINLANVSLEDIYQWTINLEAFDDDPILANDAILSSIFQDWYEENIHEQK